MTEIATTQPGPLERSPAAAAVLPVVEYYAPTLAAILPHSGVDAGKFLNYVALQLDASRELAAAAAANPMSFVQACTKSALLGHVPDGIHGALVGYGGKQPKVEFIEMYQGTLDRIRRATPGILITAGVVRVQDVFEPAEELGLPPRFVKAGRMSGLPNPFVPARVRGDIVGAFAYAKFPDNTYSEVVMLPEEDIVAKYQKTYFDSDSKQRVPTKFWRDWPEEMRRKTALLRLETVLPTSTEFMNQQGAAIGQVREAAAIAGQAVALPDLNHHPDLYDAPAGKEDTPRPAEPATP